MKQLTTMGSYDACMHGNFAKKEDNVCQWADAWKLRQNLPGLTRRLDKQTGHAAHH